MLKGKSLLAASLVLAYAGVALGAVSADKAAQLGKELTLVGAEKAGNKDGTIPEYTGGLTKPPASYKKGTGWRPDPFEEEKPLYSITAKNMNQHADKLSEGVKAMLKKYPTFRLDVYKTHRTAAFPKYVTDNTVKHALTAKTANGGLSFTGAHGGFPFPIPQDGYEAMWNHILHYGGVANELAFRDYTVDSAGRPTMQVEGSVLQEYPYYDPSRPNAKDFYCFNLHYTAPARRVGEAVLLIDPIDNYHESRRAWQYLPGQRRTKLAPDLSFDTPSSIWAGQCTWDDLFLFSGSMERYNMKLIGKKEMYIPYNDYKMMYWTDHEKDLLKKNHLNPDKVRWELHRIWVVEATLKPGKRHLYHRQVFYLDEDSWVAALADKYDSRGQLYRVGISYITQQYDVPCPWGDSFTIHDLVADSYMVCGEMAPSKKGIVYISHPYPAKLWTPESLAASGVR
jgi:hypothetical protein